MKEFANQLKTDKKICFLHSVKGGKSILAIDPKATFSGNNLDEFKKFVDKHLGCLLVGYLSYDLAYQLHNVKQTAQNDLKLPMIQFHAFEDFIEFEGEDEDSQNCDAKRLGGFAGTVSAEGGRAKPREGTPNGVPVCESRLPRWGKRPRLCSQSCDSSASIKSNFQKEISKEEYERAFEKIQKHITEGDIYQINLTHRLKKKTKTPPRELFLEVIKENPVNFSAYMEGDGFEILSASPERFVKIENGKIETCPIKGTRPRGKTQKEDEENKKSLMESEKEAAELNMITDLLRNDLGKVCEIGSVKVEGHRIIQKCPTVWHTYSKITGKLRIPPLEAIISMLPGGSITGCPKKRAIEIIDEIEPVSRGVYTGIIGYISPDQKTMDFSIAIRTLIKKNKIVYLQVGGGIVADSKKDEEFKETMDKARSFFNI